MLNVNLLFHLVSLCRDISSSQQNFFKMLDQKIEQGADYDSCSETEIAIEEARLNSLVQHWESASLSASMCSSTSRSLQNTPVRQAPLKWVLEAKDDAEKSFNRDVALTCLWFHLLSVGNRKIGHNSSSHWAQNFYLNSNKWLNSCNYTKQVKRQLDQADYQSTVQNVSSLILTTVNNFSRKQLFIKHMACNRNQRYHKHTSLRNIKISSKPLTYNCDNCQHLQSFHQTTHRQFPGP